VEDVTINVYVNIGQAIAIKDTFAFERRCLVLRLNDLDMVSRRAFEAVSLRGKFAAFVGCLPCRLTRHILKCSR